VLGSPAAGAPPLAVVALSLGRDPDTFAPAGLPGSLVVAVELATATSGRDDPVSVTLAESAGRGVVAWLVEGPPQAGVGLVRHARGCGCPLKNPRDAEGVHFRPTLTFLVDSGC
jgi:hypothetical protein